MGVCIDRTLWCYVVSNKPSFHFRCFSARRSVAVYLLQMRHSSESSVSPQELVSKFGILFQQEEWTLSFELDYSWRVPDDSRQSLKATTGGGTSGKGPEGSAEYLDCLWMDMVSRATLNALADHFLCCGAFILTLSVKVGFCNPTTAWFFSVSGEMTRNHVGCDSSLLRGNKVK